MEKKHELTPRREMFCFEYLKDLNGTQAALRSGYGKNNAHVEAARLLANDKVASRIKDLREKRQESTQINAEWVLKELQECYFALKKQNAHKDALKGLDLIGKHVGVKAFDNTTVNKNVNLHTLAPMSDADREILMNALGNEKRD